MFDDFLVRPPSDDELNTYVTQLRGGATPGSVASTLMHSKEFYSLLTWAVYSGYLGRFPTSNEETWWVTALGGRDFAGMEEIVLGGQEYYDLHGSTAAGFVNALYQSVFQRDADPTGLATWTTQLNNGVSRQSVATSIIRSNEAARQRVGGAGPSTPCTSTELTGMSDVPVGSYCLVLDRTADQTGLDFWTTVLRGSGQVPDLWLSLASSHEYYVLAQSFTP